MSYSKFPNYYEAPGSSSAAVFTDPSSSYTYDPSFFDPSRPAPAPRQGGVAGFIKGVGEFAEKFTPLAQEIANAINVAQGKYYNLPSPFGPSRMAGEGLGEYMGSRPATEGAQPRADGANIKEEITLRLPAKMAEAFGAGILQGSSANFFNELPAEVLAGLTPKVYTEYLPRSVVPLPRIGDPVR
jgi:hypothetical protein